MVIVSNGFNKFHLSVAAEELHKRSQLSLFLTGAYPTDKISKILKRKTLKRSRKLARLLSRQQDIEERLIVPLWRSEFLHVVGQLIKKFSHASRFSTFMNLSSILQYGSQAIKHVRKAAANGAKVYHYRAGFGHKSVEVARDFGMIAICDYSIAHGALLEFLIQNQGQFPRCGDNTTLSRFWSLVLQDTKQADYVLVNSDFVKDTFLHQGWPESKVKVIYWGIDDQFLSEINDSSACRLQNQGPLKVLYAGSFTKRKGIDTMVASLNSLTGIDWHLTIAGAMTRNIYNMYKSFLKDSRVEYKGILTRRELAYCMLQSDVFLFPSLAEGSARVIFEAMAAGCYVITTRNSGSIVKTDEHGCLIPSGSESALTRALCDAYRNRPKIQRIGDNNAKLIKTQYRQKHYGDHLIRFYKEISN